MASKSTGGGSGRAGRSSLSLPNGARLEDDGFISFSNPDSGTDFWDERSAVDQAMKNWAEPEYAEWASSLSLDEKASLKGYKHTKDFYAINKAARSGDKSDSRVNDLVGSIDSALNKGYLRQKTILWRGFEDSGRKLEVGGTITDHGFSSISLNIFIARGFSGKNGILLKIRAPKGTKTGYMETVDREYEENEMVLPRGSRFRIRKVYSGKGLYAKNQIAEVDLLSPE
jgi:hypothetical protein